MKFVLAMLFPMAMTASTFSATVNCGSGPIGGSGVSSASCLAPGALSMTSASVSGFGITVAVFGGGPVNNLLPTASAMIDVNLLVNVTGSTGTARFAPCFLGAGDHEVAAAFVAVSAAVNGDTIVSSIPDFQEIDTCVPSLSFTFGQPFTIDLTLSGQGGVSLPDPAALAKGGLSETGYEVVDPVTLNPIPGAIISVTETPEPNTALLMMLTLGLAIFLWHAFERRRKRRLHRFRRPVVEQR